MIVTDPEGKYYGSAEKIEKTRKSLLAEIQKVVKAQQAKVTSDELEALVEIRTWSASCYEFAHFDNEELANGIMTVHQTINGLKRDELVEAIEETRRRLKDIKEVWSQWEYKVSKVDLAKSLWPALSMKIQKVRVDESSPTPEIVEIVHHAHLNAQNWRYRTFVLPNTKTE